VIERPTPKEADQGPPLLLPHTAATCATLLACQGVRNSSLEDLHAGMFPRSQTGDYPDVKGVSPSGAIAWNRLGRMSDEAMQQ
jgi:hypothetical protein